jgi:hypothetical protein
VLKRTVRFGVHMAAAMKISCLLGRDAMWGGGDSAYIVKQRLR